jgi:2-polyprenyl-6-methoxyphenol hydroxylase-like FAD-dependent oxidoreductase
MLVFANGARIEAEFVVGADGVRSVIRQALYGEDSSWRIALSVFGSARRRRSGSRCSRYRKYDAAFWAISGGVE